MTRDQWFVVIGLAVALFLVWRHVRRQEAIAAAHLERVGNARAMVGIAGTIISFIIGD